MGGDYFYGHLRDCFAIHETAANSSIAPEPDVLTTRTLAANNAVKLEEPVRDATAAGYRVLATCDGELEVLLEEVRGTTDMHPALIVAAKRAATLQAKLNVAGKMGFRLIPPAIGIYRKELFGIEGLQTETHALMEQTPHARDEYLLVTGQANLNSAAAGGYVVVAMHDLLVSEDVISLEKRLD